MHAEISSPISSLEVPREERETSDDALDRGRLLGLVYEGLVRLDGQGRPAPALAQSWTSDADATTWTFQLRPNVHFSDGTPLTPSMVAGALSSEAGWRVTAAPGAIVIQLSSSDRDLPFELALPSHAIRRAETDGIPVGTGPFSITTWEQGRRIVLQANDAAWSGRPFVDSVEVNLGRPWREESIDLETGKADVVEIPLQDARQAQSRGARVEISAPQELLALVFLPGAGPQQDERIRQALEQAINRQSIWDFLLQKQGESARSLLPQWISGTAFLFANPAEAASSRDSSARGAVQNLLTIGYDPSDVLAREVADRIVVDARAAGMNVQAQAESATGPGHENARIVRWLFPSPSPRLTLRKLDDVITATAGQSIAPIATQTTAEELYRIERGTLESRWVIPLAHLPAATGVSARVRNWPASRMPAWPLADVWIDEGTE